ncbi:MAG: gluconate 2-dehydrogenase subunit 3 family protein [Acidobacteria bacterium]|nr:gluconate 2-dehydrogenase subunit 3 family protein [Acidobacteriota bacterium]
MKTRRQLLQSAAAAATALPSAAQHAHAPNLAQIAAPYKPKVLTPTEMDWLAKLVDAIIPGSDTPGASDAGVPAYVDRHLAVDPRHLALFRDGKQALDAASKEKFGKTFSRIDAAQQAAVLTPLTAGRFFRMIKDLTIDGYYTSKEGLAQELGWNANTFLPEFPGCTHPEHQS